MKHSFQAVLTLMFLLLLGLSACSVLPIVSDKPAYSSASAEEHQRWLSDHIDEAIVMLGEEAEWKHLLGDLTWHENRADILQYARRETCRPRSRPPQPSRLHVYIGTHDFEHPYDAATRLREHWENQGAAVHYISDPENRGVDTEYFRADFEGGAFLTLSASTNFVSLTATTSCSDHFSMLSR